MRKFFILMSHKITDNQVEQAKKEFGVSEFINISDDAWSCINPSIESVKQSTQKYKDLLKLNAKSGDILLVQGDFGATYDMVSFAKNFGLIAIYATTKRVINEVIKDDGTIVSTREFRHERFREYES